MRFEQHRISLRIPSSLTGNGTLGGSRALHVECPVVLLLFILLVVLVLTVGFGFFVCFVGAARCMSFVVVLLFFLLSPVGDNRNYFGI